jgi:polar amino acid transport system permease protein/polar amino acid transport system substrate-binding protein
MSGWYADLYADFQQSFIDGDRWRALLKSLGVTLELTALALVLGIVLGIFIAVIRSSHDQMAMQHRHNTILSILNAFCKLYLTIIRGTPVMVQLLIMYFVILANSTNTVLTATLTFGINSGAYVAEIIRSGIMSIDKGQMEAGRSLGLNYVQTMWDIIIPQAIKNILPALGNEFITLLKETSIVNVIGMRDITKWAINVQGRTYQAFMPFIGIALIYLVMVVILSRLVSLLERRLNTDG